MKRLSSLCTVFTTYRESIISNKKLKRPFQVPLRCNHQVRPQSGGVCAAGTSQWVRMTLGRE